MVQTKHSHLPLKAKMDLLYWIEDKEVDWLSLASEKWDPSYLKAFEGHLESA